MSITLTATWHPRGETHRFRRLYPLLSRLYDHILVVTPSEMVISFQAYEKITLVVSDVWATGRYRSLEKAVETGDSYIHYADLDRLVRWAETQPKELEDVLHQIHQSECLVIGRDQVAYATHPLAIVDTEAASNRVFSHILGMGVDLSAGSKGFRRDVAQFIVKNSTPKNALGTDSEWVILAWRGGFEVEHVQVRGLDWESADRYRNHAADAAAQEEAAATYDADALNWKHRVTVANEIISVGIETLKRQLKD
jgi:hypothetical protein